MQSLVLLSLAEPFCHKSAGLYTEYIEYRPMGRLCIDPQEILAYNLERTCPNQMNRREVRGKWT